MATAATSGTTSRRGRRRRRRSKACSATARRSSSPRSTTRRSTTSTPRDRADPQGRTTSASSRPTSARANAPPRLPRPPSASTRARRRDEPRRRQVQEKVLGEDEKGGGAGGGLDKAVRVRGQRITHRAKRAATEATGRGGGHGGGWRVDAPPTLRALLGAPTRARAPAASATRSTALRPAPDEVVAAVNFIVHSALKAAEAGGDGRQEAARQQAVRVWQFLRGGRPPARGVPLPPPPHVMPYIDAAPSVEQWPASGSSPRAARSTPPRRPRRLHDAVAKEGVASPPDRRRPRRVRGRRGAATAATLRLARVKAGTEGEAAAERGRGEREAEEEGRRRARLAAWGSTEDATPLGIAKHGFAQWKAIFGDAACPALAPSAHARSRRPRRRQRRRRRRRRAVVASADDADASQGEGWRTKARRAGGDAELEADNASRRSSRRNRERPRAARTAAAGGGGGRRRRRRVQRARRRRRPPTTTLGGGAQVGEEVVCSIEHEG